MKGVDYVFIYDHISVDKKQRIKLSDIHYMTYQLHQFIKTYESKIYTPNPDDKRRLQELKQILHLLETEQYDKLFNDVSMIEIDCQPHGPLPDDYIIPF